MPSTVRVLAAATLLAGVACGGDPVAPDLSGAELSARVSAPTGPLYAPGTYTVDVDGVYRKPILYVPPSYDPADPAPLVVLFHGAAGSAESWQSPYGHADRLGLVLLIMQSRLVTWDMIQGGFGPDVAVLDSALVHVFERTAIDPDRVVFAGFSDGASYALSLAMINSPLVSHGAGFSPGSVIPVERPPLPRIFVSHGTMDRVLPIDRTQRLVSALAAHGFDVRYYAFAGGHEVPPSASTAAFDWMME